MIGAVLGLLLSAGAPPAETPPDPATVTTATAAPRREERSGTEPDPELLRNLDLLQNLDLLDHLDLFQ